MIVEKRPSIAPQTESALLDYDAAAAYLGGLSRSTLKLLRGTGAILAVRVGKRTLFPRSALDEYIQRLAEDQRVKC
jgi:excisionase family DNA binding protein